MVETTPARLVWKIAGNREKFLSVFGASSIVNTLFAKGEPGIQQMSFLHWALECSRVSKVAELFGIRWEGQTRYLWGVPLLVLSLYSLFQKPSLLIKSLFFISCALILFLLGGRFGSLYRVLSFSYFLLSFLIALGINQVLVFLSPYHKIQCVLKILVLGFFLASFSLALSPIKKHELATEWNYFIGKMPILDTYCELLPEKECLKWKNWVALKKEIGLKTHIVWLSPLRQEGYTFPGTGAILNPSFLLGKNLELLDIIFGEPGFAIQFLKKKNWNFFLISPKGPFNNPLVYSHLFERSNLKKYFSLVKIQEDFIILTWKDNVHPQEIPKSILEKIDFARNPPNPSPDHYRDLYRNKQTILNLIEGNF